MLRIATSMAVMCSWRRHCSMGEVNAEACSRWNRTCEVGCRARMIESHAFVKNMYLVQKEADFALELNTYICSLILSNQFASGKQMHGRKSESSCSAHDQYQNRFVFKVRMPDNINILKTDAPGKPSRTISIDLCTVLTDDGSRIFAPSSAARRKTGRTMKCQDY